MTPQGLSGAEVAKRREAGATNAVARRTSRSVASILRANLFTFFNGLIGVLAVLALVFGAPQDALFGLVIVVNSAIGVAQELRAKRSLDRLALVGAAPVRVIRDGAEVRVDPADLVLDDVVLVGAGDRVPVDGVLVDAAGLEIDESLLTGEADPIAKRPGDEVRSGSFGVAGQGAYTATGVGEQAYAARLVKEASKFSLTHSELLSGITRLLRYITVVLVPVGILLVISQLRGSHGPSVAVVRSVAGVVPMVPEGLVLLTSIAFAVGVVRLARRDCLVRELPAIEGLARVDVLCLDKTGTLTEPGLVLDEIRQLDPDAPVRPALAALVAAEARPNPTLAALATIEADGEPDDHTQWTLREAVPFSSARKWSAAAFDGAGAWVLGAPDVLLPEGDGTRAEADRLGATGLRVLLLARVEALRTGSAGSDGTTPAFTGPVRPAALVLLRQRVRPDARQTLAYFAAQGVAVKVISGDNADAVGAIAGMLGLPGADRPVDARTLPDEPGALAAALDSHSVFGRVTPRQKREFVSALRSRGHTVAMTGDGVNDVLALKDADLGIAMGSGSAAARAVAQVVLLDDRFATLPAVVGEGRRVLANIERVANLFLTKTIYSVVLAFLIAVSRLPYPFLPRHITLLGALTIGIPAFVLALAPSGERAQPRFVRRVLRFAVPAGLAAALATFAGYGLARLWGGASLREDSSTATIVLGLVALWVLALIARPYTWWRVALVLVMAASFLAVPLIPLAARFFDLGLGHLDHTTVGLVTALAGAVVLTAALRLEGWLPGPRYRIRR